MAQDSANLKCACTSTHAPRVEEFERHHVVPKSEGGKTVAENLVWLCPTAHSNAHKRLRALLVKGVQPRNGNHLVRAIAQAGYTLILTDAYARNALL